MKNKSIGGSQFTRPKRPTQNLRATRYMHSKVEDEVGVAKGEVGVAKGEHWGGWG